MSIFSRLLSLISPARPSEPGAVADTQGRSADAARAAADQAAQEQAAVADRRARADRIRGGLLGVHAGDSLGATLEFKGPEQIRAKYGRHKDITGGGPFGWQTGDPTDDTDLTWCVARAYRDGTGVKGAADNMVDWLKRGPRDVGGATSSGLRHYMATGDPAKAGAGQGSAGNGSLMRCIATGLLRSDPELRRAESEQISAITHDDQDCQNACAAYNEMVAALVDGKTPDEAVQAAFDMPGLRPKVQDSIERGLRVDLAKAYEEADQCPAGYPSSASGYVLHSLALSVAAVRDPRPMEDVLVDVVNIGGDTDTNGAICGGILGARDGASALPGRWVATLALGPEMEEVADLFAEARERGMEPYQVVDEHEVRGEVGDELPPEIVASLARHRRDADVFGKCTHPIVTGERTCNNPANGPDGLCWLHR
jgi:ADP-ribosylglycohydrolase